MTNVESMDYTHSHHYKKRHIRDIMVERFFPVMVMTLL